MNLPPEPDNHTHARVEIRTIASTNATEFYLTAAVDAADSPAEQLQDMFKAIHHVLQEHDAWIQSERIFVSSQAAQVVEPIRAACYRDWAKGVGPTYLLVPVTGNHAPAAVQIHALAGVPQPTILFSSGQPQARLVCCDRTAWLTINALHAPKAASPAEQVRSVFEQASLLLRQAGGDLSSVVRTWFWLRDISTWYGKFNAERNDFFAKHGLIGPEGKPTELPASTGVGIMTPSAAFCTLDLLAVLGDVPTIQYVDTTNNQQSAYQYGSAFSRAVKVHTPAGETVFVSGTAAIDAEGRSQYIGQAHEQIEATLHHAKAALAACGCTDDHVLSATAYCKNEQVRRMFLNGWSSLPWPQTSVIADICREELLFEIELVASPTANRTSQRGCGAATRNAE